MAKGDHKPQEKKAHPPPPSSLHPPYLQMIMEAISSLKDRTGSSQPAIAKVMEEKYINHLPPNFKKILSVQLKKFVESGKLMKIKNSYKTPSTVKPKKDSGTDKGKVKKKAAVSKKPNKSPTPKKMAKKAVEKAVKMKRLSQVKTPEALKRKSAKGEGVKKASAPAKRKASSKPAKSTKTSKKDKN